MSHHPINLVLSFVLELAALGAVAYWGWTQHDGLAQMLFGVGLPVLMAAMWGIFRVDGDPKPAPVRVHGVVRLLLEAAFFGSAALALVAGGRPDLAAAFGLVVVLHYATSWDRMVWLLQNAPACTWK